MSFEIIPNQGSVGVLINGTTQYFTFDYFEADPGTVASFQRMANQNNYWAKTYLEIRSLLIQYGHIPRKNIFAP